MVSHMDHHMNCVIINNTQESNKEVNERLQYASDGIQRKDIFDKHTFFNESTVRERLNNADEIVEYNGKNLWLNFWYIMQEQPWQLTVNPEQLINHYWFKNKLYIFASDTLFCNFVLLTKKDIVDTVCDKVPSGDEKRIKEVLEFQIKFREEIEKYHFDEIVYTDTDFNVDSELKQKVVNIYNEIK
tara:strand:- start:81 stop:638 length:558 start_codon:yes stop_codon:yes gene_type:complete